MSSPQVTAQSSDDKKSFSPSGVELGFSVEDRNTNLQRITFVAAELARAGAACIVASTAPTQHGRDAARETVIQTAGAGGNFFTIHVATPQEHCERTDRKELYAKARRGEVQGIPGVDQEYEVPSKADLTADLTTQSVPEIVHSEFYFDHLQLLC